MKVFCFFLLSVCMMALILLDLSRVLGWQNTVNGPNAALLPQQWNVQEQGASPLTSTTKTTKTGCRAAPRHGRERGMWDSPRQRYTARKPPKTLPEQVRKITSINTKPLPLSTSDLRFIGSTRAQTYMFLWNIPSISSSIERRLCCGSLHLIIKPSSCDSSCMAKNYSNVYLLAIGTTWNGHQFLEWMGLMVFQN